jgi:hypothetical protein
MINPEVNYANFLNPRMPSPRSPSVRFATLSLGERVEGRKNYKIRGESCFLYFTDNL